MTLKIKNHLLSNKYLNLIFLDNIAYDLPIIAALATCHHATAGFYVKETWCQAIAKGKYATWPGLTVELARRHCPNSEETFLGTMSQKRKNIRSTKKQLTKIIQRQ